MKIGFSSLVCPGWDLDRIITSASEMGFDGVELRGLRGELHLPLVGELAGKPDQVRQLFRDRNVELVCLGTSATLSSKKRTEVNTNKAAVAEFIELAGKLGCPYVRIFVGEVQKRDNPRAALARVARELSSLVPGLERSNVTLLVENGGDFPGSQEMWFLIDALAHPLVKCCWNQCHAMALRERPTNSIPRLGNNIGLVHLCDALVDEYGLLREYTPLGKGDVEIAKQIELLRGLLYDRYLMFEWPKLWIESLPPPEEVLPNVAGFLRERLNEKQTILAAYKGDKHAPKLAPRQPIPSGG